MVVNYIKRLRNAQFFEIIPSLRYNSHNMSPRTEGEPGQLESASMEREAIEEKLSSLEPLENTIYRIVEAHNEQWGTPPSNKVLAQFFCLSRNQIKDLRRSVRHKLGLKAF